MNPHCIHYSIGLVPTVKVVHQAAMHRLYCVKIVSKRLVCFTQTFQTNCRAANQDLHIQQFAEVIKRPADLAPA